MKSESSREHREILEALESLRDEVRRLAAHMERESAPRENHSIDQAAAAIGVSRRTICSLIASGRLGTLKVGKRRLVPQAEVEKFLRARPRA